MPGPKPPSASYLLKIVDSSDEEEEEEEELSEEEDEWNPQEVLPEQLPPLDPSVACAAAVTVDESPTPAHGRSECPKSVSPSPPKKKKKKKNRNKNRKKKSSPIVVIDDAVLVEDAKKSVSFDQVTIHSFERCLGVDVVPYDGGWPLGLGPELGPCQSVPLEDYESHKQDRLRERALLRKVDVPPDAILETRQWDFKNKLKNPLFHLLLEDARMDLLLDDELDSKTTATNNNGNGNTVNVKRRDSHNHKRRDHHNAHSRTRSASFAASERYNETYTQVLVHRLRHELEELRFQRTKEGHVGCTCRKLDVYLLPPNAGKKAHHRRLKVLRVKEELKKRHLLPPNPDSTSREELELLLHAAVEREGCCGPHSDCPCLRNGIQCQADVCNCWNDSHQIGTAKTTSSSSSTSVPEIQTRCGNPEGMYAVDLLQISELRKRILNQGVLCCPPISPDGEVVDAILVVPENDDEVDMAVA